MSKQFATFAGDKLRWSTRLPAAGQWSTCFWVKPNSSSAVFRPWFYRCNNTAAPFVFAGLDNAGALHTSNSLTTATPVGATGATLTIGTWYHCALTYNYPDFLLYLNGFLTLTASVAGGTVNATNDMFMYGHDDDADSECGLCSMCCIKAWDNVVLTPDQVNAEMPVAAAKLRSGLVWEAPLMSGDVPYLADGQQWDTFAGVITDPDNPDGVRFGQRKKQTRVSAPVVAASNYFTPVFPDTTGSRLAMVAI